MEIEISRVAEKTTADTIEGATFSQWSRGKLEALLFELARARWFYL